jgi:DNA-binding MarR family transcriptional regulator
LASSRGNPRRDLLDGLDLEERRNLQTLEAIAADDHLTQRTLADRLGIALGLANIYLKRLVHKGFVKCVNLQSNRLRYLLTPKGIAEKSRLTYEFMQYSLFLYGQVRQHLHTVLEPYTHSGRTKVAVYGTGEAAELAYLSIAELGLELVAVFDGGSNGRFLGHPVRDIARHGEVSFDLLLVATFQRPDPIVETLIGLGVPRERLVTLRQDVGEEAAAAR